MTQHIGTQRSLASIGPRCLVIGDAIGRHDQGRDGIDECRFAGAYIAGQQSVLSVQ